MKGPHATVLYEDQMLKGQSGFPLHDLVMRLVEDDINGEFWRFNGLVAGLPRKGIDKIIEDLPRTGRLAGSGQLMVLVDSDRIAEHLKLPPTAARDLIITAMRKLSDQPDKLQVFFLRPNLEGLLRAIKTCDPTLLPNNLARALAKKLNDRDLVFKAVKKAQLRDLRDCVRGAQPGFHALAQAIAASIPR